MLGCWSGGVESITSLAPLLPVSDSGSVFTVVLLQFLDPSSIGYNNNNNDAPRTASRVPLREWCVSSLLRTD